MNEKNTDSIPTPPASSLLTPKQGEALIIPAAKENSLPTEELPPEKPELIVNPLPSKATSDIAPNSGELEDATAGTEPATLDVAEASTSQTTATDSVAPLSPRKPVVSKFPKTETPSAGSQRRPKPTDQAGLAPRPKPPAPKAPEPEPLAEPRKPPEWKVLEPDDQSDPVKHEECQEGVRNDRWTILAASVRGKLHAHKALWRDDAFAYGWIDDWTILVVSDGAGSARISRIGARIACDEALKVMKELLAGYRFTTASGDTPGQNDLWRLRTFLSEGTRKAQLGILREAQKRGCPPRDMNATFLMAVHCPWNDRDFVGAIQVGDGAVGLFLEGDVCTVLGSADHGEYSSETRFLTTPGIEYEFDQRVRFCSKKGVRCIAVMCDGVSDDFFPEDKRLIELFIGNPIQDMKTRAGDPVFGVLNTVLKKPEGGKALLDWLRYEKKQSSDDRTLLLMHGSEPK